MSNRKDVSIYDITPIIEELISGGTDVRLTVTGSSMFPMLRSKTDSVIITKIQRPLKKYDIPLYKRKSGQYVLHRIVDVKNGEFTMNGDNQYMLERPIYEDQFCGVVKAFYRNGKLIECSSLAYRIYCRFWVNIRPLRGFISKMYIITVAKLKSLRRKK